MNIKRLSESRGHTDVEKFAMKATAVVVFVVVIVFAIPLCCEGRERERKNAVKELSPYGALPQHQPLSEKSLKIIADSKKWLKGVIDDPHLHSRIKRVFLEIRGEKVARTRAKRWWWGAVTATTCLADAALAAIDKACDSDTSELTTCHTVVSALRTVMKIVSIADGSTLLQLICDHLGELSYHVGQFLRQLVCQWAQTTFDDNPVVDFFC